MSVLDLFRLDGKRALITGGSRGLGRGVAQALAEAGADLVLVSRDADSWQTTREELTPLGRRIDLVPGDMGAPAAVEATCRKILDELGPIHILINNVGGRRESVPV